VVRRVLCGAASTLNQTIKVQNYNLFAEADESLGEPANAPIWFQTTDDLFATSELRGINLLKV
jgi:hypothetical protein